VPTACRPRTRGLQPRLIAAYGAGADDTPDPIRLYRALNHLNGAVWSIANDLTGWTDDLCRVATQLLDGSSRRCDVGAGAMRCGAQGESCCGRRLAS
jgi:hypothetical protein